MIDYFSIKCEIKEHRTPRFRNPCNARWDNVKSQYEEQNRKMNLTRTQSELLKLALKTFPIITTLGGALFGYMEGHEMGHNYMAAMQGIEIERHIDIDGERYTLDIPPLPWHVVLKNTAFAAVLGLTGGIAVMCVGLVLADLFAVVDDPINRQKNSTGSGANSATFIRTYYKKLDVTDHERSTTKVAEKYDEKKKKEEAENQEILEIGTKGIREKIMGKKPEDKKQNNEDKKTK